MIFASLIFIPLLILPFIFKKKYVKSNIEIFKINRYIYIFDYLYLIIYIILVLAIMRPQIIHKSMSSFQGINISVALDLSKSMEAADIGENRLEASKSVIIDFINKRPIDKIGLVVFAKQALPKVPATLDHSVLIDKIKEIAIEDIPSNGTDIGKAIAFSVATLKNCEGSKAIVLVTDGSDTSGSNMPITSAEIAKKLGIKIYTIGVGSTTPTDIFGSFFRVGEIDEELLEKISHITNGKYYRASNEKELQNIFNEIDNLEKTNLTDSSYDVEELFLDFLKIAIFLLLFTTIFTETIWTEV